VGEVCGGGDQNRILPGLNTVAVRTGSATSSPAKMREIHCNQELLPRSLAAAGIRAEEVEVVINAHLHFDHCDWNPTLHHKKMPQPTQRNRSRYRDSSLLSNSQTARFLLRGLSPCSSNTDRSVQLHRCRSTMFTALV
jgi:hypothetical protein